MILIDTCLVFLHKEEIKSGENLIKNKYKQIDNYTPLRYYQIENILYNKLHFNELILMNS